MRLIIAGRTVFVGADDVTVLAGAGGRVGVGKLMKGAEYAANRHNIGFMVVDELARQLGAGSFRSKMGGELAEASPGGSDKIVLLKPQQYMNLSGQAVQKVGAFYRLEPARTIVVHDEIDLPYETLRLKVGETGIVETTYGWHLIQRVE